MNRQVSIKKSRKKAVIISVNAGSSSLKFSVFLITGAYRQNGSGARK
ncbi:hypothetical protein NIASO_02095 [Niabella soli DSM 19437]|uniref:Butyrate kinase n=1 Tax=Niabella soli DSM 19437 TaxID=929713 RepID=W0F287_9BACT|nr:hypothetical protein NIASO_02095 [Niabella soli DSM 19437]